MSLQHWLLGTFIVGFAPIAAADCFEYDELGRLVGSIYSEAGSGQTSYTLDEHGNRENVQIDDASSATCEEPNQYLKSGEAHAVTSATYIVNNPPTTSTFTINIISNGAGLADPVSHATDPDGDVLSLSSFENLSPVGLNVIEGAVAGTLDITHIVGDGPFSVSYIVVDSGGQFATGFIDVYIIAPTGDDGPGDDGDDGDEIFDPELNGPNTGNGPGNDGPATQQY